MNKRIFCTTAILLSILACPDVYGMKERPQINLGADEVKVRKLTESYKMFNSNIPLPLSTLLYGYLNRDNMVCRDIIDQEYACGDDLEPIKQQCCQKHFDLTTQWPDEEAVLNNARIARYVELADCGKSLGAQNTFMTFIENENLKEKLINTLMKKPLALLVYAPHHTTTRPSFMINFIDPNNFTWLERVLNLAAHQSEKTGLDIALNSDPDELSLLEVACLAAARHLPDITSFNTLMDYKCMMGDKCIATDPRCQRVFIDILKLFDGYRQAFNKQQIHDPNAFKKSVDSIDALKAMLTKLLTCANNDQNSYTRDVFVDFLAKPVQGLGNSFRDAYADLFKNDTEITGLIDRIIRQCTRVTNANITAVMFGNGTGNELAKSPASHQQLRPVIVTTQSQPTTNDINATNLSGSTSAIAHATAPTNGCSSGVHNGPSVPKTTAFAVPVAYESTNATAPVTPSNGTSSAAPTGLFGISAAPFGASLNRFSL